MILEQEPVAVDFFGEEHRIEISDNKYLANLCNEILELQKRYQTIFTGDTMAEINRKVMLGLWLERGLKNQIPETYLRPLIEWLKNSKIAVSEENSSRALRYLVSHNQVNLPAKVIIESERHRQRLERSFKKNG